MVVGKSDMHLMLPVDPVFLLGSPFSGGSLVGAMLGQHPSVYSLPEIHLLAEERLLDLFDNLPPARIHGLWRAIAQLYTGEQTLESIDTARRWIYRRLKNSTLEICKELCQKVTPLRLLDRSTSYTDAHGFDILARIESSFPNCSYLHLVRHPHAQCWAWLRSPDALGRLLDLQSLDRRSKQSIIDPQYDWRRRNQLISEFLEGVSEKRKICVRIEDIMTDPFGSLQPICDRLGLDCGPSIYQDMLQTEKWSFSFNGPYGAEGGSNFLFQKSPHFQHEETKNDVLDGPLGWRPDGKQFSSDVKQLAQDFGYV